MNKDNTQTWRTMNTTNNSRLAMDNLKARPKGLSSLKSELSADGGVLQDPVKRTLEATHGALPEYVTYSIQFRNWWNYRSVLINTSSWTILLVRENYIPHYDGGKTWFKAPLCSFSASMASPLLIIGHLGSQSEYDLISWLLIITGGDKWKSYKRNKIKC